MPIIQITGTNGNDILTAALPDRHRLEGLAGDDKLTGGAFNDSLYGGIGSDVLDGGDGDDLLDGGEGADMLIGGTGSDAASYVGSSAGVIVDLVMGRGFGGDAAGDRLTGIENLIGSDFADRLVGDAADNRFRGDGGADIIDGGAGSDTAGYARSPMAVFINLLAGTASGGDAQGDRLMSIENVSGSRHDDTIVGDGAANVLHGDLGDDTLFGGGGADTLQGHFGDDTLEGGAGADVITGSWGVDTASYSTSNSGVKVNLETGLAAGGHAQGDVLSGIENLIGSAFGDRLTGSDGDNVIQGGNGDDTIRAGAGADIVWGEAGDDTFVFDQSDQPVAIGGTNFEVIADFTAGGSEDVIDLIDAGTGFMSLDDVLAHAIEVQTNGQVATLIDLGPSGQVLLAGVGMADLTQSDFILV